MDFGGLGHLLTFKDGNVTYRQQRTTAFVVLAIAMIVTSKVTRDRTVNGHEPVVGILF